MEPLRLFPLSPRPDIRKECGLRCLCAVHNICRQPNLAMFLFKRGTRTYCCQGGK